MLLGTLALLSLTWACDKENEPKVRLLPTSVKVGDQSGGGIVFYIAPDRTFGLVAPSADQSEGIAWSVDRRIAFDSDTAIGSGAANSEVSLLMTCITATTGVPPTTTANMPMAATRDVSIFTRKR